MLKTMKKLRLLTLIKKIWIIGPILIKLNYHLRLNYYIKNISIIFFVPIAIPLIFLIRAIKPIIHIRFRFISTPQIGHFIADTGILLCESVIDNNNIKDWYWLQKPISNSQIEKMVKRIFYVRWWVRYLYIANHFIPGGKQHSLPPPRNLNGSRDVKGLLYKTKNEKKAYLPFTEKEEIEGKEYLKEIGLKGSDKFVCLLVRDGNYQDVFQTNNDWSYHNYRNSDIDTYSKAAIALAKKGYWVFRMGKFVLKPFDCKHKKVIDYSLSSERNDFLDIWLMSHCSFCITTSTGLDEASKAYRRPLALLNFLPIGDIHSYISAITYFKQLRWKKNNKKLTLTEYFNNDYYNYQEYQENEIDIIDLTEDEIKDAVLEMEERFSGKWKDEKNDIELQNKFWQLYKARQKSEGISIYQKKKLIENSFLHPESKISTTFLRNNLESLG